MGERLKLILVAAVAETRSELRALLESGSGGPVEVVEAAADAVARLLRSSGAGSAPCVVLVDEPPRNKRLPGEALARLAGWAAEGLLQRGAVVAVVEGRAARRAALRAGAQACVERRSLSREALVGAVEDALDRLSATTEGPLARTSWGSAPGLDKLWEIIEARMGVCPSFFKLARHEPTIAWALYGLAEFAYLDSPIPALFKEQLFTYLSRLCPVPYCLARHCAFLLGRGRVAGDASTGALGLDDAQAILDEPHPSGEALARSLEALEQAPAPVAEWPRWDSELGYHVRVACLQVFVHSYHASRWLFALQRLLGRARHEQLMLLLAFVRMAHFWTEIHPELGFEPDLRQLLQEHELLAATLAATTHGSAQEVRTSARLHAELVELRQRVEAGRQLRQFADAVPAYISYVDPQHRYVFVNHTYIDYIGRPVEAIVGETVDAIWGSDKYRNIRPKLETALRGEMVRFEQTLTAPGRGSRQVDTAYVPDRGPDGSVAGCFVLALDVTERKQAEDMTRRVLDNLFAFVAILELDGTLVAANRAPLAAAELRLEEVAGRKFWDCPWWTHSREVQDRLQAACARAAAGELVREDLVARVAGDRRMIVDLQIAPLRDASGRITHLIPSGVDVTARVRVEQRLREVDRRKDEFLAMLGHELRNPLAAISSAAELLRMFAAEQPRLGQVHDVLERQSNHMLRLIDGLLEVSRVARGKVHLERASVDLREVLGGVLRDHERRLGAAGVRLEVSLAEEPLWVWGDAVRLAQIFDNLIHNAIKFSAPAGRVEVTLASRGAAATIRVRDTGVGLREDQRESIFEPFQQGTQGAAQGGGLGLGLALVKGLVEVHGGEVEARSDGPGLGAEFRVRLPLIEAAGEAASGGEALARAPAAARSGPALRVMIVEDNADAAEMLQALLRLRGHEVVMVGSGPRALELLREREADVVLCDLGLPGMSGYEVARAVREDVALRDLILIALTGYGQADDRRRTAEAGFDDHLVKPVDLGGLERVLIRASRARG